MRKSALAISAMMLALVLSAGAGPAYATETADGAVQPQRESATGTSFSAIAQEVRSRFGTQWWRSQESLDIAEGVLASQRDDGGWCKDPDAGPDDYWSRSTIDNNVTLAQVRFLAKSYSATGDERCRDACLRGIDFLLASQYENGGWPQIVGAEGSYHAHVTFNDGAQVGAMRIMRAVADRSAKDGFGWIDDGYAQRAEEAFGRGLDCVLQCQVQVDGRPTAWCQQYDEVTLSPAAGRSYEPIALSTWESTEVVRFLQGLPYDPKVAASIDAALDWFDAVKLQGVRFAWVGDDRQLVEAPPDYCTWARFYDLEDNTPVFSDRDGGIYRDVADISQERRTGYDWYGLWPLLCQRARGADAA